MVLLWNRFLAFFSSCISLTFHCFCVLNVDQLGWLPSQHCRHAEFLFSHKYAGCSNYFRTEGLIQKVSRKRMRNITWHWCPVTTNLLIDLTSWPLRRLITCIRFDVICRFMLACLSVSFLFLVCLVYPFLFLRLVMLFGVF